MTSDHADFYLGTGLEARWVGSLAEFGPVGLSAVGRSADSGLAALLIAENADAYEAAARRSGSVSPAAAAHCPRA